MVTPFEFATAGRIVFGWGKFDQVSRLIQPIARRWLVVHAPSMINAATSLADDLQAHGVFSQRMTINKEPNLEIVAFGVSLARSMKADGILGIGGGAALDLAKAVAALSVNPGDTLRYLEVVGEGQPLETEPLPVVAIPTTAGTGSEVTRNAVIGVPEQQVKVSLRDLRMLPAMAVIDPQLCLSLPAEVTAYTGMDALTQVIEPFISPAATPMTDGLCRTGIVAAAQSLRTAVREGANREAREGMSLASLMGGLALANAKLGAVHGFAGPLGGMLPAAPHGAICGRLLPTVMKANLAVLSAQHPSRLRMDEVAQLLTGNRHAQAEDGVQYLFDLAGELDIPGLGQYGLTPGMIGEAAQKAQHASSMKGNPVQLNIETLEEILAGAL